MTRLRSIGPAMAYPFTMSLIIAVHAVLMNQGAPLVLATYMPIVLGAALVWILEVTLTHRREWQARPFDVRQDAAFMAVVQVALPKLLGFGVALVLVRSAGDRVAPLEPWWPGEWPVAAQAALMLIVAESMRYWLHRAAHNNALLWRLHAVHHSPERLYWLNVGRFHPIEKILQYGLDTLPFILVGASEQVLAAYYVFYAVNGFFQHSNVELKMGPLNHIISSAELHRWHHSKLPEESNQNYGNNLIIFDTLFGTRFLPKGRSVGDIGVQRPDYPEGFIRQMALPDPSPVEETG